MTVRTAALFSVLLALLAPAGAFGRERPPIYKGAIMVDAATGEVLFADHADEISPPASMTKLMTFAVVEDQIRAGRFGLDSRVRIDAADQRVGMLGDSSHVGLRAGESFTVDELFYALMVQSANDAAYAIARSTAGNIPAFVARMNAKARALGMTRTLFRSPNGLPPPDHRIADGDLTTPRDYATLARYLLSHTDILRYTRVRTRYFGVGVRFPPTPMKNQNRLLGRIEGVDGLKTGYTRGAGFCLTATAERGGRRLIVVVMDAPDWRDLDLEVARLLERGFQMLAARPLGATLVPVAPPSRPAVSSSGTAPAIHFSVP